MDKRTLLAVIISVGILFVWQFYFMPAPTMQNVEEKKLESVADDLIKSDSSDNIVNIKADETQDIDTNLKPVLEPISIKSNLLEIRFDPDTGDIRNSSILGWKGTNGNYITFNQDNNNNYFRIITPIMSGYSYEKIEDDTGIKMIFTSNSGGMIVTKEYFIPLNSYLINSKVKISNSGDLTLNIPIVTKVGPQLGDGFEDSNYVFEGAIISNSKEIERISADKSSVEEIPNPLWGGYTSKYFLFAVAGKSFKLGGIAPESRGEVTYLENSMIVNPGDRVVNDFDIYIGPKNYNELKSFGLDLQNSIDFGWFYFLAIPMLQIMNYLYSIFHNYGVAIIILTIIVKIITLPLTLKSMSSMKSMSKVQPEMMALKEKFKNEPQKLNIAMMELYKKHNINPMSGCLPLIIQIPIFFALYKALLLSIELKDAPFFGYLVDLSAKDPYYITPIIMGITMFIQQKMTPSTADPVQQKIFLFMPIIFTFLFLNFPSGLVLYWLTNNVLSIIQQFIVNKKST